MTDENQRQPAVNEEIQETVKSNVSTIQDAIRELEGGGIEQIDGAVDLLADGDSTEAPHYSGEPTEFEIHEVLTSTAQPRLAIAGFNTVLTLLDFDKITEQGEAKLMVTNELAGQLSDKFPVNSYFQKLDERDNVEIRQGPPDLDTSDVIFVEDRFYYPLALGTVNTYLEISHSKLHRRVLEEYDRTFKNWDQIDLAVPPWKESLRELSEATSSETVMELETLVEAATPEDLNSLDEVSLALIAAARTGALQYIISKWGEEMSIGSKATFSRRKSSLVDDGVITTESVQVEIGRPRERLLIADDYTEDTPQSSSPEPTEGEISQAGAKPEENDSDGEATDTGSEKLDDMVDNMLRDILLEDES